ncbi:sugar ABC transporter ATP-binding protein [Rubellimicrobium arenae]|uniref:sugar ABC transporter ATP-binding protein n=1 Tax=Rubellimicrobium arenae TaxID=2817372 RepID=UPI001B31732A|nr:sugar ABC transporter ATP-binding protein [Rubellimicrobium arenae]
MTPLIALSGISKSFGPVQVLTGIDLVIEPGQVVGLLGENGAGKSTLMNVVSGRHRPDGGRMELDGAAFAPGSVAQGIASGIRFVHQELSLAPSLSVAENLFLGNYLSRRSGFVDRKAMRSRARTLLEAVGLGDVDPGLAVSHLRAGEQQLVEIAKAMVTRPRLLILDEPTSSLTPAEAGRLFALVRDLARAGTSVIFITHRIEEALANCDRIVVLRDGRLVSDQSARETSRDELIRHMVGREALFAYRGGGRPGAGAQPRARIQGLTDGTHLAPISLDVAPGEVVGLFGLLGSGRTEFLETLYGFRPHKGGSVEIDGTPIVLGSVAAAVAAGITLVPEGRKTRGIFPTHSVRRNISASSLARLSPMGFVRAGQEREETDRLSSDLGIRMHSAQQAITTLSGGNQQKAIFARAMEAKPRLLLLDEPTHGVDVGAKADIYDIIHQLAREGLSLIVASSELTEILAIADRCLVMSAGEQVAILDRDEMSEETILRHAFTRHA